MYARNGADPEMEVGEVMGPWPRTPPAAMRLLNVVSLCPSISLAVPSTHACTWNMYVHAVASSDSPSIEPDWRSSRFSSNERIELPSKLPDLRRSPLRRYSSCWYVAWAPPCGAGLKYLTRVSSP